MYFHASNSIIEEKYVTLYNEREDFGVMIRFICIAVFLILYLILSIPVFLVEWIIGKFNRRAKDISSLRIVQWGFKVILKMTGVTTTVIGDPSGN